MAEAATKIGALFRGRQARAEVEERAREVRRELEKQAAEAAAASAREGAAAVLEETLARANAIEETLARANAISRDLLVAAKGASKKAGEEQLKDFELLEVYGQPSAWVDTQIAC